MNVKGKKYLIIGIARSGLAAAELLVGLGAEVVLNDRRSADQLSRFAEGFQEYEHILGDHPISCLDGCDGVVVSPGVPLDQPLLVAARARNLEILGEVELAWRFARGDLVGITGTNGKTTTTMLTANLLAAAGLPAVACGNMGHPFARAVNDSGGQEKKYVCELSSFQLESFVHCRPRVAVLLNLTPDHLDRYPDLDSYYAAKGKIFGAQTGDDFVVVNLADPLAAEYAGASLARKIYIGADAADRDLAVYPHDGDLVWRSEGKEATLLACRDIGIPGPHNLENALAATAVALAYGCDASVVAAALKEFQGVEHRLENVRSVQRVRFINDSKATNVASVIKSLQSFREPIIWIGGGRDKGGDFSVLEPLVAAHVHAVVLLGELSDKIAEVLPAGIKVSRVENMNEAVRAGYRLAKPGDVVLLSPGGTSFDLFTDFEERGRIFKECVSELAAEENG